MNKVFFGKIDDLGRYIWAEDFMDEYIADWVRKNFPEYGDAYLVVEVQVTHSTGDIEILRDTVYVDIHDDTHQTVMWTHDQWEVPKKFVVLNIARIEDMIFP